MKILAFTDIHASKKAFDAIERKIRLEKPDLLIDCGDISIFENRLDFLIERVAGFGITTLILHGNHESREDFEEICRPYKNIIFMHGRTVKYDDIVFFGWGGGGFSKKDDEFEKAARELDKGSRLILLTHAPPYDTKIDEVFGMHAGNKSIRRFIEKRKPLYAFCGHLHENNGKKDRIGETVIINPGPYGKIVKV